MLRLNALVILCLGFLSSCERAEADTRNTDGSWSQRATRLTSGTLQTEPSFTLRPASLNFGEQKVGFPGNSLGLTVLNTGASSITLQTIPIQGPFAVGGPPLPRQLPPGASTVLPVYFRPTSSGDATGTLTLVTDQQSSSIPLFGTGVVSIGELSPTSLDFGRHPVGTNSPAQTLTVRNTGTSVLVITHFILDSLSFRIDSPLPPLVLSPGKSTDLQIRFSPDARGLETGRLYVISDAYSAISPVSLQGLGTEPLLELSPTSLAFGEQHLGTSSQPRKVTVRNISSDPVRITHLYHSADQFFSVTPGAPFDLQPSASRELLVTFSPVTPGPVSGTLSLTTDKDPSEPSTISLSGTGVGPHLVLMPSSLDFGQQYVGASGGPRVVRVINAGINPLRITRTFISPGAPFAVPPRGPVQLWPGESYLLEVTFNPATPGTAAGGLILELDDPDRPSASIPLSGIGVHPPGLLLNPSSLDFGKVLVGQLSAPQTLTLFNGSSVALIVSELSSSEADSSAFILSAPPAPMVLQPRSSLQISLALRPNAERPYTGWLTMVSSDQVTPRIQVPLSGLGVRQLLLSESSLDFGKQLINATSPSRKVRLTNDTGSPLVLQRLAVEEDRDWQLLTANTSRTLHPGQWQDVEVAFTPRSEGKVNGTLRIFINDPEDLLEVALQGEGISSSLSLYPSVLDFGVLRSAGMPRQLPLLLTNQSNAPIILATPEVTFSEGEPFTIDLLSLKQLPLMPGSSHVVMVGYDPRTETSSGTTINFSTEVPLQSSAAQLTLRGAVVRRFLSIEPEILDFGSVDRNVPPDPMAVTIINQTPQQQRVVVRSRTENSPFTLETGQLADPIPAGGKATFVVGFDTSQLGTFEGELAVSLQGESEPEALLPVSGRVRALASGGGGSLGFCNSTGTGASGMLALLMLAAPFLRRRRNAGR